MRDIERMVKLLLYVTIVGGVGYWAYQNVLPAVARMIQGGGESSGGVSTAPTTGASDTAVKETGQAPAGYDFGPAKNTKPARTTLSSVAIALTLVKWRSRSMETDTTLSPRRLGRSLVRPSRPKLRITDRFHDGWV